MKRVCPVCKKTFIVDLEKESEQAKLFPFCSRRCKLADLGAWLDDKYKIISPTTEDTDRKSENNKD